MLGFGSGPGGNAIPCDLILIMGGGWVGGEGYKKESHKSIIAAPRDRCERGCALMPIFFGLETLLCLSLKVI